jgi:hypothetical protein
VILLAAAHTARAQAPQPPSPPVSGAPALVAPPSWAFVDLACAPYMTKTNPAKAPRILGSQDTGVRDQLSVGDTLVVSGGASAGLNTGDRFYVRRLVRTFGQTEGPDDRHPLQVHTAGWIQILGVDSTLATAKVVQACDSIMLDDYLEPYVPPTVAERPLPGNSPTYDNMGHIRGGASGTEVIGIGQMASIDRGSTTGVVAGQRFLVFRDKRNLPVPVEGKSVAFVEGTRQVPLVEIGEVMVVSVRADDATVQVLAQKDAIMPGDLIAAIR